MPTTATPTGASWPAPSSPTPADTSCGCIPRCSPSTRKEQVDTFIHEIGHVFGLRHFFANISEKRWPSEIFGKHKPFSIMNYGDQSELTDDDKSDLKRLYQMAWDGELTEINGTEIRLVKPFHTTAQTAFQPQSRAAYTSGK